MLPKLLEHRLARTIAFNLPRRQLLRYLVVGGMNTLLGYAVYAALNYTFSQIWPDIGYLLAVPVSSVINITFAFLTYKFFIFKTRGNYLREWLRCVAVYASSIALQTALLPCLVFLLHATTPFRAAASYVAAAILTVCAALYGFVAHRRFSFAATPAVLAEVPKGEA